MVLRLHLPDSVNKDAGCPAKAPMKSPISGACPITIRQNIRNSSNKRGLMHDFYTYECAYIHM